MNTIVGYAVLFLVLIVLIDGAGAQDLQRLFILLLILFGAITVLIKGKLHQSFWGGLFMLIVGPIILLYVISALKLQCQQVIP
ncbi:MAG: hypothetical protein DWQ10_02150 [Calditrichaeota bacterium]|nr:MAG: hypothetical protein DWQ10_02150 [Calditrichota bacterium]